jgi:PAS domain-containing protein
MKLTTDNNSRRWEWIENWPEATAVINQDGMCIALNSRARQWLGLTESDDCIPQTLHAVFCGGNNNSQHDAGQCPLQRSLDPLYREHNLEAWWPDAEGIFQQFNFRLLPLADNAHILLHFTPVADGEHSIAQAIRLARFTETASNPMMEIDRKGAVLYANQSMTGLMADYGFRQNGTPAILPERFGDHVRDVISDGRELAKDTEYTAPLPVAEEDPFELTATYPQAEPQTIAFAWRYTRNDSELEPLINLSGFDNTAVFKTLAALRKQEETYRLTLSVAMEGVLDWFASKSVCLVSDRCFEMLGRTPPKEPDQSFDRFVSYLKTEDAKRFIEKWQGVVCGMRSRFELTVEARGKSRRTLWLIIRGKAVEKGQYAGAARVIATVTDVSQIRQYQDVVRLQRTALDQALTGISIIRPNGEIEYANARWSQWFGETHTADKTRLTALLPQAEERLNEAFSYCLQGQSWEFRYNHDMTEQPVWMTFFPLTGMDGRVEGIVCFARDILEDEKKEAALIAARLSAEAASQARDKAMSSLEAELKDPVGNIEMALNLLQKTVTDTRDLEWMGIARGALVQLKTVAKKLFEAMSVESATFAKNIGAFNLQQSIERLHLTIASEAYNANVPLDWQLTNELPGESYGDEIKIGQLLGCLLQLGIGHNRGGLLEIRIALPKAEENTALHNLHFRMKDQQHHFTSQELHQLQQPFALIADKSGRLNMQTALNLAICRRITDVLGGEFSMSSSPETGTLYAVSLPLNVYQHEHESAPDQHYSTAVDMRFLRSQYQQAGIRFLSNLEELSTGMAAQLTVIKQRSEDFHAGKATAQSLELELESLRKAAGNYALLGLERCCRQKLETCLQNNQDASKAQLENLQACLDQTRAILKDFIQSLRKTPD